MTWLSRKPRSASGASAASDQAPARLPIAFQVQTVSAAQPSISLSWALVRPCGLVTSTQSPSARL